MQKRDLYFLILITLHSSLLVTSTLLGSKFFALPFDLAASATVLSYMMTFVIILIIAELYGVEYSQLVIGLGFCAMALSALYFLIVSWLPPAKDWFDQGALELTFDLSWRVWVGGWIAYIVSQPLNVWLERRLKDTAVGRRAPAVPYWISMNVAQLIDTIIFMLIAKWGTKAVTDIVISLIVPQYLIKVAIVTLATPLVSWGVALGRGFFGGIEASKQELRE
jgi:uncharacterized integral membrane protein (TIGR00697 family)